MTGLPEGFNLTDAQAHAMHLKATAELINIIGVFLEAETASTAEREAEMVLNEYIEGIINRGPDFAGSMILALASLVATAGEEAPVQAWFDQQADRIKDVLGG